MVKIIVLAGSVRKESMNQKIASAASSHAKSMIEVEYINLKDYPMPIYDGDIEMNEGVPISVKKLRKKFIKSNGFIIASPEYNSSISPLLKNVIDWLSRKDGDDENLAAFTSKIALLISASPGKLRGIRGLTCIRSILQNIGVVVFPEMLAIQLSKDHFNKDGSLVEGSEKTNLEEIVQKFCKFILRFQPDNMMK